MQNTTIKFLAQNKSRYVIPGRATNRFEVIVKPSGKNGVDIYINMNGSMMTILYNQAPLSTWVGLGMSFHSVTVGFDNFEYEELVP